MWKYQQSSGKLSNSSDVVVSVGYSGAPGLTKNNPEYQDVHNEGPIPQGRWQISSLTIAQTPHGPYVLHLFPYPGTDTFGRDGFLIHGDSFVHPGAASEGCIIMDRATRELVWHSIDHDLLVVA